MLSRFELYSCWVPLLFIHSTSCVFMECYHHQQDIIIIDSTVVKLPFKCSNPEFFSEV